MTKIPQFTSIFRRLSYRLGGHYDSMVYALEIPFGYGSYDICHLEMLNIVVVSKLWAVHWKDRKIRKYCDNMAVVQVLNTGRAQD